MSDFGELLTFSEWMDLEYGDEWPTSDVDFAIWNRFLAYVEGVGG